MKRYAFLYRIRATRSGWKRGYKRIAQHVEPLRARKRH